MFRFFAGIGIIGVVIAAIIGWIMNIAALVHMITADAAINALFVGRAVGIFFVPLGAVLGYF